VKNQARPTPNALKPTADYQTVGVIEANLPVFYKQLKAKLTSPLAWRNAGDVAFDVWQKAAREKVLEYLTPTADPTPFQPEILTEVNFADHLARKISFNLTAESRVLGLMLIPKGAGPFPAVLLLHDHGAKFDIGKEKLIAPWDDSVKLTSAQAWVDKLYGGRFLGEQLVKQGYLVLAVDALGWSDRGLIKYETQQALASNLLNLGSSLPGLMIGEDLRAAAFLASLPEVAATQVAALGFSTGAFRAWQAAALSPNIAVGAAVCWMAATKSLMIPGNNLLRGQSAYYMTLPGLIRYLDHPDVASIAAPKPLLFYAGELDPIFPAEAVKEAFTTMRHVWRSQGASARLETKVWPGCGHEFNREQQKAIFDWLDHWLKP
jgi:dienelactone hydrolase